MYEVTNKSKSPVQVLVRSRKGPREFTCLNIPGIGKNKNVVYLEDEKIIKDVMDRVEKIGLIKTRYIPNSEVVKGE